MSDKITRLWKNKNNLIVLILLGILLLVVALPVEEGGSKSSKTQNTPGASQDTEGTIGQEEVLPSLGGGSTDASAYAAEMEKKLENALSQMADVGRVKVVITMKSSAEKVVEKDEPVTRSNTAETDSQGGSRNINSVDMGESTVLGTDGGSSQPYVVKVIQPEVEGVMVIAEGAGSGNVSRNIAEAVEVLFNIEAHKIKVARMKAEE